MWAVVEIAKKQYLVNDAETLLIQRLKNSKGEVITQGKVEFDKVLLVADQDNIIVGKPYVANAKVGAEIIAEEKGDKIRVYKFKRRKKYRRTQGHRQTYARLKIASISLS